MAESKKTSGKVKNTRHKSRSTGTKHKVIDGISIDKPVSADAATASVGAARSADINVKEPKNGKPKGLTASLLSKSAAIVVSGVAVLVAFMSLAVSLAVYWQTADLAEVGQPGVVTRESGYADPEIINDRHNRLTALVNMNSEQYASLANDISVALALDSPLVNDLINRLTALEMRVDSHSVAGPAATPAPPIDVKVSFEEAQIGLLVAAGLLAAKKNV